MGTLIGVLPPLAAFVAVIWYAIQIRESKTIQDWLKARRQRKINALREKLLVLQTIDKVEDIKASVKEAGVQAVQGVVDAAAHVKTQAADAAVMTKPST